MHFVRDKQVNVSNYLFPNRKSADIIVVLKKSYHVPTVLHHHKKLNIHFAYDINNRLPTKLLMIY